MTAGAARETGVDRPEVAPRDPGIEHWDERAERGAERRHAPVLGLTAHLGAGEAEPDRQIEAEGERGERGDEPHRPATSRERACGVQIVPSRRRAATSSP